MGVGKSKEQSKPPPKAAPSKGTASAKPASPPPKPAVKAAGEATATDMAILELKEQRDQLNRVTKRSVKLADKLNSEAARWLRTDDPLRKEKALRCLKRKKIYEQQLKQLSNMQDNVETTLNQVEMAKLDAQVFSALKAGGDALRALQKDMGDVEKAMDEIYDAVADAQAISALMAQQLGVGDIDLSDEAMEAELQTLASPAPVKKAATVVELPKVPTHVIDDGGKVPTHAIGEDPEHVAARRAEEPSPVAA